jgi:hypothetical protein
MNKEQLKKNVGDLVRPIPIAHRLDGKGHPLPQMDDERRTRARTISCRGLIVRADQRFNAALHFWLERRALAPRRIGAPEVTAVSPSLQKLCVVALAR